LADSFAGRQTELIPRAAAIAAKVNCLNAIGCKNYEEGAYSNPIQSCQNREAKKAAG